MYAINHEEELEALFNSIALVSDNIIYLKWNAIGNLIYGKDFLLFFYSPSSPRETQTRVGTLHYPAISRCLIYPHLSRCSRKSINYLLLVCANNFPVIENSSLKARQVCVALLCEIRFRAVLRQYLLKLSTGWDGYYIYIIIRFNCNFYHIEFWQWIIKCPNNIYSWFDFLIGKFLIPDVHQVKR